MWARADWMPPFRDGDKHKPLPGARLPSEVPEDPDHDVGIADLHPLVDQALRTIKVKTRTRVGLPTPNRQPTTLRRRQPMIQPIDHRYNSLALGHHVAWRDHHNPHDLNGTLRHARGWR